MAHPYEVARLRAPDFGDSIKLAQSSIPRGIGAGATRTRAGKPNPKGMALLPAKFALKLVIIVLQVIFIYLDRMDEMKNDPFGWSAVAAK